MNIEEKELTYILLKEEYEHLNNVLMQIYQDWKKIEQGDEYKEPEETTNISLNGQIKSEQDYKAGWNQIRSQQQFILTFFLEKDMIHLWFKDHPEDNNHTFLGRLFRKPGPISHVFKVMEKTKNEKGEDVNNVKYLS